MKKCLPTETGSLAGVGAWQGRFLSAVLTVFMGLVVMNVAQAESRLDFSRDIRPLLSDRCFFCHGPDEEERKADLRLDLETEAKADRSGEAAIVPGKPSQSLLMARILTHDADDQMPPPESGKSLSESEIALLDRWISEGAEWAEHWAYRIPQRKETPVVTDNEWPRNWVDHWVLSRLEAEGLEPAPDADPVTLARRLSFDLCGLVPTADEVVAFAAEPTRIAYLRMVDAFLDSPQFGERMASYWLDLVRFADTVGYHGDQDHSISPYRDYVIDAFNENMPFDRFTREQLAGDLLENPSVDQLIATGYNRLLQTSHEGGVQVKEYLAIYAADRVRNLSGVWMGATMGCAQCHDHKYDPIKSKDFYAMQAFFADVDEARHFKNGTNDLPTRREPEIEVLSKRERALVDHITSEIGALVPGEGSSDRKQWLTRLKSQIEMGKRKIMVTQSIEPRPIRLLPRGNWLDDSGPVLEPAVPEFLGQIKANEEGQPTRRDLANWLVDVENGAGLLTARVMVNRFWYLMFGSGLSRSLDDFGGQGEPPFYGELLDQLAVEFVVSGWDIKHMFRLIAASRVYQQGSGVSEILRERDPYNQWLARQSSFRLPAESIRDSILRISGLLNAEIGGKSVKPYQPEGYYRHLNFPPRQYQPDENSQQWRRGVYVHWQRQFLHPMMAAFDAPTREECTAQRPLSNTPVAALVLLNDPTFVEAAEALADRIQRAAPDVEGRLQHGFREALSRAPDETELALLGSLVETPGDDSTGGRGGNWTLIARAILNLSETITRY